MPLTIFDGLFSHTVQRLQAGIRAKLAAAGIEIDDIEGLNEVFQDVPNPFEGRDTLGLQVSPPPFTTRKLFVQVVFES